MRAALLSLLSLTALALEAGAQSLPPELPLPPGLTITGKVQRLEYDRDDFTYPTPRGSEHVVVAGHLWKAFYKNDAAGSVASWKTALQGAGWQILGERQDMAVARHGDWWVKIGLDRLTLVEKMEAGGLELAPPGEKPEELKPNTDIPYLTPRCRASHARRGRARTDSN